MVGEAVAGMYTEFKATNDERFWMAGVGCSICALKAFKELGVVDIPYRPILNSYKKAVDYMRASMKSSVRTAVDVLNSYTRDNYGSFVVIKPSKGGLMAELGSGKDIDLTPSWKRITMADAVKEVTGADFMAIEGDAEAAGGHRIQQRMAGGADEDEHRRL